VGVDVADVAQLFAMKRICRKVALLDALIWFRTNTF
jgi:hypothetical protein